MNDLQKPIGFFDSGVGGLSVLQHTLELLPNENYIYYGDLAHAPYGSKPLKEVRRLTNLAVAHLLAQNIKALVVACNTATSAAIDEMRTLYPDLPILGIEPALKPAVEATRSGTIVVMATERTLSEKKFSRLSTLVARERTVYPMMCPGLVELIEAGDLADPRIESYLRERFAPLKDESIAAVVLGCTHYPFIRPTLERILGPAPLIFDGAEGISRHLERILTQRNLRNPGPGPGEVILQSSDHPASFEALSRRLLSQSAKRATAPFQDPMKHP
ncbi:Glutamate racemase [Clostridiaceae bacterium JG1575]|nr:Glutamate racemase [Clostridiaceae bacterium JG1575]